MTVFDQSAQFYDSLYKKKGYELECDFLEKVFARYASESISSILDLGCGTGGHTLPLAQRGYHVTGVDSSEKMLSIAQNKLSSVTASAPLKFTYGDIRTLDLECTFDAVIAMFDVISYMTSNDDLMASFRSARRHLNPGGIFMFDAWFGPAVLTTRPTDRFGIIETDDTRVLRLVTPELDLLQHIVKVHYRILHIQGARIIEEINETHNMRFLFPQEVIHYLDEAGFACKRLCPFPQFDENLSEHDWKFAVVGQAI